MSGPPDLCITWSVRKFVFHHYSQLGLSQQAAYDLAMCAVFRTEGKGIPWGAPSEKFLASIKGEEE